MYRIIQLLVFSVVIIAGYAFPSADAVDLFSGQATYEHPLFTLNGRGNLDITLQLDYSSRDAQNVWERNDNPIVGRFGLGWEMDFGSITCIHKNTMSIDDDIYFWVSGGSAHYIRKKTDAAGKQSFFIEDQPYWKLTRFTKKIGSETDYYEIVTGWSIVNNDGIIKVYGDCCDPPLNSGDKRNATWYTFAWKNSGYVGNGNAANPLLYPVTWDISEKEDRFNNKISYEYNQTKEKVYNSAIEYTKNSCIEKITNSEGAYFLFEYKKKEFGEYYDPYTFENEPDGFIEVFDDHLISTISAYSENQHLLRKFTFCFKKICQDASNKTFSKFYTKSLLTDIIESNDNGTISKTIFSYYDKENEIKNQKDAIVSKLKDKTFFGALKSVQNKYCGTITYEYKKQDLGYIEKTFSEFGGKGEFGSKFSRMPGYLSDGTMFFVIANNTKVWLYQWNGYAWKKMKIGSFESGSNLGHDFRKEIICGFDYFVVASHEKKCEKAKVFAFSWNGSSWEETLEQDYSALCDLKIFPSAKYFVVDDAPDNIDTYYWDSQKWIKGNVPDRGMYGNGSVKQTFMPDYFAYKNGDHDVYVNTWNGIKKQFEETKFSVTDDISDTITFGDSYFVVKGKSLGGIPFIKVRSWDGVAWQTTYENTYSDADIKTFPGIGYFTVVTGEGFKDNKLFTYQWNGKEWIEKFSIKNLNDGQAWDPYVYNYNTSLAYGEEDYCMITSPRIIWRWGWSFLLLYIVDVTQNSKVRIYNLFNNEFIETNNDYLGNSQRSKMFLTNNGYSLVATGELSGTNNFIKDYYRMEYPLVWDGKCWRKEENANILKSKYINFNQFINQNSSDGKAFSVTKDMFLSGDDETIRAHQKINGSFEGTPFAFVVDKIIVNDGATGNEMTTKYLFNSQNSTFDIKQSVPRFNTVEISKSGSGKSIYHFFNGYSDKEYTEQSALNSEYENLGGQTYKIESYNEKGKLIGKNEYSYDYYTDPAQWAEGVYDIRLTKTSEVALGVKKTVEITSFENKNGLPEKIVTTSSDGKKIIEKKKYAFRQYSGMDYENAHILTPVCEQILYDNTEDNSHIKKSTVQTWEQKNPDVWVQNSTYKWLGGTYNSFWQDNTSWSEIENKSYDGFGNLQTALNPGTTRNVVFILGFKNTTVISEIANSGYNECAVFTCNYDDMINGQFYDLDNRWEKGGSYLSSTQKHFGEQSVYVGENINGLSTTLNGIDSKKNYEFSAWVYPDENCDDQNYILLSFDKIPAISPLPVEQKFTLLQAGINPTGGWQKIKFKILSEYLKGMDPNTFDGNYLKVTLKGVNVGFYVDDIRFLPENALAKTFYYNSDWKKIISKVDENGNVERITYDDQMRPENIFNNEGQKTAQREYYTPQCNTRLGDGSLSKLEVKTLGHIDRLPVHGLLHSYNLTYDNSIESATIQAEAKNEGTTIKYRVDNGSWNEILCKCEFSFDINLFPGVQRKIEITGVAPSGNTNDNVQYTIYIKRSADCWIALGDDGGYTTNSITESQLTISSSNIPYAASIGQNGKVQVRKFISNAWTLLPEVTSAKTEMISLNTIGDYPVLAYIETGSGSKLNIKKYNNGWTSVINGVPTVVSPDKAKSPSIVFNSSGIPYIAYNGNLNAEQGYSNTNYDERVIVKKAQNGEWVSATGQNATLPVSEESASELVLRVSPAGDIYVAYISKDNNGIHNDVDGKVIVKKLVGTQWINVGDFISGPTNTCKQLSLGFVNGLPCVAYAEAPLNDKNSDYQEFSNDAKQVVKVKIYDATKTWLPPFRSDIPANYSHWIPLGEQNLLSVGDADAFRMVTSSTTPYILFQNEQNNHRVSVIAFNNSAWKSVGKPGFGFGSDVAFFEKVNLAIANNSLFCAYPGIKTGIQNINTYELNGTCPGATLCNLTVNNGSGELVPDFKEYILNYKVTVDNFTTNVTLTPTPCETGAAYKIYLNNDEVTGPIALEVGSNFITTVVTAADGYTRTEYSIEIVRKANSFSSLCSFEVFKNTSATQADKVSYTPAFDPNCFEYTVNGNFDGDFVYVRPISGSSSTIYVGSQTVNSEQLSKSVSLSGGENNISIKTVAADGATKKVYNLKINKQISANCGLTNISTNGTGSLTPVFNTNHFNYEVNVLPDVSAISFTLSSNGAEISTGGGDILKTGQTPSYNLGTGSNEFTFVASPALGEKGTVYKVNVKRPPPGELELKSIEIKDDQSTSADVSINPGFNSGVTEYTAMVGNNVKILKITPTVQSGSSIRVAGLLSQINSGSEFYYPVDIGLNELTFIISKDDKYSQYTFKITREAPVVQKKGYVYFESPVINVYESDGKIKIPVLLNSSTLSDASVEYRIISGSAVDGTDYEIKNSLLQIPKCQQMQEIEILLKDDKISEEDKWFKLALENPVPDNQIEIPGNSGEIIVNIIDDDIPSVSFETNNSNATEGQADPTISVKVDGVISKQITVYLKVEQKNDIGWATFDKDFTMNGTTLIFQPGDQNTKSIPIAIVDDANVEGNEQVIIKITDAEGAVVSETEYFHKLTIKDNDVSSNILLVNQHSTCSDAACDGKSWATAYKNLYDAIDFAKDPSHGISEIWVAEGVYLPKYISTPLEMLPGVKFLGGFPPTGGNLDERDWINHETVLSGDIDGNDNDVWPKEWNEDELGDNARYAITGATNSVLDGFIIEHTVYYNGMTRGGTGMSNYGVDPYVLNCTFRYNWNDGSSGGGAVSSQNSNARFYNCKFVKNISPEGGAVWGYKSGFQFYNCLFDENKSTYNGGAIYLEESQNTSTFTCCTFVKNESNLVGGAMWVDKSNIVVTSCIFYQNVASDYAGIGYSSDSNNSYTICYSRLQEHWYGVGEPSNTTDPITLTGDYHLTSTSQCCINKGSSLVEEPEFLVKNKSGKAICIDNSLRFSGSCIDMGAFEFQE